MSASTLEIKNLHVSIEGNQILKGINLTIKGGEFHAVMGPNGTGKSTLASAIMGHPKFDITEGSIHLDGEDVLEMDVDERARAGRSEEHTSELQSRGHLVCRILLEKKNV